MSILKHTISVQIDRAVNVLQSKYSAEGKVLDAKNVVTTAVVLAITRGLSLPTAEVVNIGQYWWDTHHQMVSTKLSDINEVYPIYIQQALVAIKHLYVKRYELAFPSSTEQMINLMSKVDMSSVEGVSSILEIGMSAADVIGLTEVFDNV